MADFFKHSIPSWKKSFVHSLFGGFVHKDLVLLKICRKYKQASCMQRFLENTVGHFYCLYIKNMSKMCDKRFMQKNRSNVGKNVTINRCISTLISFSAFKKDCSKFLDYSYFYAFWVQIFEAQLIDKKISYLIVILLCTSRL